MSKTVLITGASSGIGLEFAKLFAENDYNLVLVARRKHQLEILANELSKKNKIVITIIAKDLSSPSTPREIFSELKSNSIQVDILINNAGTQVYGKFQNTDFEQQLQLIQTNLISLTQLTHLAITEMQKQGYGKILNIGSTGSFAPGPLNAVYCATKAYVLSFSEAIASDLKGTGITVTALCPGATKSEFAAKANLTHARIFKSFVMTPAKVAKIGYNALFKEKRVAVAGLYNQLMVFLIRFSPKSMVLWLSRILMS
jgi:short-subunit dehydrogenase